MNFSGTGSINSPIVISDDDDNEPDICFIEPPPTLYLPPGPPTPVIPANSQQQTAGRKTVPPILSDNVGYSMLLGMGYVPGMGLGVALDGDVEPVAVGLKRRKPGIGIGHDDNSSSLASSGQTTPSEGEIVEKRLKKKQKKSHPVIPLPKLSSLPQSHSGPSSSKQQLSLVVPHDHVHTPAWSSHVEGTSIQNIVCYSCQSSICRCHHYSNPPPFSPIFQDPQRVFQPFLPNHAMPFTPWLPAMLPHVNPFNNAFPNPFSFQQNFASGSSLHNMNTTHTDYPSGAFITPISEPSHSPTEERQWNHPLLPIETVNTINTVTKLETKKPIIGKLKPTGDSGLFQPDKPWTLGQEPDPQRTLVLDAIPKVVREYKWIQTWTSSFGLPSPSRIEFGLRGKVLVEFACAEFARRAFESPRMVDEEGKRGLTGITAWWFRGKGAVEVVKGPKLAEGETGVGATKRVRTKHRNRDDVFVPATGYGENVKVDVGKDGKDESIELRLEKLRELVAGVRDHRDTPPRWPVNDPVLRDESSPESMVWGADDDIRPSPCIDPHVPSTRSRQAEIIPQDLAPDGGEDDSCTEDMDLDTSPITPDFDLSGFGAGKKWMVDSSEPLGGEDAQQKDILLSTPMGVRRRPADPWTRTDTSSDSVEVVAELVLPETTTSSIGFSHKSSTLRASASPFQPHRDLYGSSSNPQTPSGSLPEPVLSRRSDSLRHAPLASQMEWNESQNPMGIPPSSPRSRQGTVSKDGPGLSPPGPDSVVRNKLATEESVHRLGLALQNHAKTNASQQLSQSPALATPPDTPTIQSPGNEQPLGLDPMAPEDSRVATLNDLAVSFITEAIRTTSTPPPPSTSSALPSNRSVVHVQSPQDFEAVRAPRQGPRHPAASTEKSELAAKYMRLQTHILETKILMAKFTAARTKQEKDSIMKLLRERNRLMEEGSKTDGSPAIPQIGPPKPTIHPQPIHWPETAEDAGVLVVSDDEDE